MAWRVEFARDADGDLALIFDHLFESYRSFGETADEAAEHAAARIRAIVDGATRLGDTPYIGTLSPDHGPGLRYLRRDGAVIWFTLHEATETLRVLAIFFGGQDHRRHMLLRLLSGR
ncbi:MAG: type II toxin-antitoxin system RelE/ParE family toxin [Pseudomonadota bacterium]